MTRVNHRLCFCSILIIVVASAARAYGQTPDPKIKPTGSISGRVTIGQKGAPGILVIASNVNSSSPIAQATSDEDGNYRLTGLAAGLVNVSPVAPVYVLPMGPMMGQGRPVNLAANEAVDGIDFKLTRGGVITGKITDPEGRPVIEERINLMAVEENGAPLRTPFYRPANFMMYQTDDRGVYRIYGLAAGHYKVSVGEEAGRAAGLRAGYYLRTFYPDATDVAKAGIVDVSEGGETKNIDIKVVSRANTYTVGGRVIDADTNQPLAGVYFTIGAVQQNQNQSYLSSSSGPGTPTNSQGEFRMEGISPGHYVIIINPSNFGPARTNSPKVYSDPVPFEVLDSDVTNLEIKAQPGQSISGVVVPEGITDRKVLTRLTNLLVSANVNPGTNVLRVYSSSSAAQITADGTFLIEGLRPGKVSIHIAGNNGPELPGFTMTRIEYNGVVQGREIDLPAGQNLSGLKIFITSGTGGLRGQVKAEGGALASDAILFVSASRQGEPNPFSAQVDSRGRFVIKNVPPGNYDVTLQILSLGQQTAVPRELRRQQRQTVTVVDGTEAEVIFTLDLTPKEGP